MGNQQKPEKLEHPLAVVAFIITIAGILILNKMLLDFNSVIAVAIAVIAGLIVGRTSDKLLKNKNKNR